LGNEEGVEHEKEKMGEEEEKFVQLWKLCPISSVLFVLETVWLAGEDELWIYLLGNVRNH
jgi:hypothetical protein